MFRISGPARQQILQYLDSQSEGFSSFVLEKDLVISRILQVVAATQSDSVKIVFGGGTSLVKARGFMDRLSEDVDLKAVTPIESARHARRQLLRSFRNDLIADLGLVGFDDISGKSYFEGRFREFTIPYESLFAPVSGIPASIKLEIWAQESLADPTNLPICSIVATALGEVEIYPSTLPITALEEMAPQKVIAMLTRFHRLEAQPKLIRHVYDLWRIRKLEVDSKIMQSIFDYSLFELPTRSREFDNPYSAHLALSRNLVQLSQSEIMKEAFAQQLSVLAIRPPMFSEVMEAFLKVANSLVSNSEYHSDFG
jgi:predicted nucleotidyltransferase component of viral defense system